MLGRRNNVPDALWTPARADNRSPSLHLARSDCRLQGREASCGGGGTVSKLRVGYIGVGLMGHGAAKNILANGHPLTIIGHRNREPVDDLVGRGAREARTPAEVASESDVVFTCLPSSVEVEATMFGGRPARGHAARDDPTSIRRPPIRAPRAASAPSSPPRGVAHGRRPARAHAEGGRGGQAQHVPGRRSRGRSPG